MPYASDNLFAKILRGEIPCKQAYESTHVLAFWDIAPKAKVHILVIPKGAYATASQFYGTATDGEILDFARAMATIPKQLDLETNGLRWITNQGKYGHQEVPHFHMHLLGGEPLGPPFV